MDVLKIWFSLIILSLIAWLFIQPPSLTGHLMILIWLATIVVIFQLSKEKAGELSLNERLFATLVGFLVCIFSFTNIGMGIGNPPYSIDDFSVLLVGATVVFFAFLNYRNLLLPTLIPLVAFLFFHLYDRVREWFAVVAAPLEIPVVVLTVSILKLLGVGAYAVGNVVTFPTKEGALFMVPIVFDCTGVESMGAYLITAAVVFYFFKKMPINKKLIFLAIGVVGTYLANILRVVAICMSGYYYGYSSTTEMAHAHLGWIIFTAWMLIYWTAFFFAYRKPKKRKVFIKRVNKE